MATFDYQSLREAAEGVVTQFGAKAILRRASGDRDCWAVETAQTQAEKQALKNFNTRVFMVSTLDLEVPPSKEDSLIVFKEDGTEHTPLRQAAPPLAIAPLPGFVLYYQLQVE